MVSTPEMELDAAQTKGTSMDGGKERKERARLRGPARRPAAVRASAPTPSIASDVSATHLIEPDPVLSDAASNRATRKSLITLKKRRAP